MYLLKQLLRFPSYLWIAGVYPILHLYAENFGLVHDYQVAQTIAVMLIVTSLAYLVANSFMHNPHKSAFFLGIASLYFSTSGHLYIMFFIPKSLLVWIIASAIVVAAISIACNRFIPKHSYAHFTAPINLIAAALLVLQIITLLAASVAAQRYVDANSVYNRAWDEKPSAEKVMDSPDRPDIYYIIPDGYPSDEQLLQDMNIDNSEFSEALRERGFVIAPHAQSNYGVTQLSLATTLNMQYYSSNPTEMSDMDHLRLSSANSKVAQELLRLGYTYVQFVSGYVLPSPIADINRDFAPGGPIDIRLEDTKLGTGVIQDRQSEKIRIVMDRALFLQPFTPLYIDSTALRIVRSQLEKLRLTEEKAPFHGKAAQRFLDTVDEVENIVAMPEATFTIIHLMQPHAPVNFNEAGDIIEQIAFPGPAEFYADLRFSNSQFLELFDTILQDSTNEPVIIFQADHGGFFGRVTNRSGRFASFDVFAAYHLPAQFTLDFPKTYTLINAFALILNEVFDTEYELQESRLFEVPKSYHAPFEQLDVTEEFLHK